MRHGGVSSRPEHIKLRCLVVKVSISTFDWKLKSWLLDSITASHTWSAGEVRIRDVVVVELENDLTRMDSEIDILVGDIPHVRAVCRFHIACQRLYDGAFCEGLNSMLL